MSLSKTPETLSINIDDMLSNLDNPNSMLSSRIERTQEFFSGLNEKKTSNISDILTKILINGLLLVPKNIHSTLKITKLNVLNILEDSAV